MNLRLPCPVPPLPGRLGGAIPALAIRPEAAGYEPNFIEIISPVHLRRALGLRDWDLVELWLDLGTPEP